MRARRVRGAHRFAAWQVIDAQLKNAVYNPKKTDDLSAGVINAIIKDLLELKKPFKYAGSAHAAAGSPLQPGSLPHACPAPDARPSDLYFDAKDRSRAPHRRDVFLGQQDGRCADRRPSRLLATRASHTSAHRPPGFCKVAWENNTMHCIVTVYGMAIFPSPQPGEEAL